MLILEKLISKYGIGKDTPGCSILVKRRGESVFSLSIGVRDALGNPITLESNFRLASITKQFTAVAILQLIEKGELSLATPLSNLFSDFPDYGESITIQHLLTHTSGIEDYESHLAMINTPQISDEQVLLIAKQQNRTMFPPGLHYQYSNGAYCILALIVSKISGLTFEKYLQEYVFPLAHMHHARLNSSQEIPNRVYGFSQQSDNAWFMNDQNKTSATQGDGGIYASVRDLVSWQENLYRDKKVISEKYIDLMVKPHVKTDKAGEAYGFGVVITNIANQRCCQHGGDSVGFQNALFYLPEQDISLAILSNLGAIDMMETGKKILEQYRY